MYHELGQRQRVSTGWNRTWIKHLPVIVPLKKDFNCICISVWKNDIKSNKICFYKGWLIYHGCKILIYAIKIGKSYRIFQKLCTWFVLCHGLVEVDFSWAIVLHVSGSVKQSWRIWVNTQHENESLRSDLLKKIPKQNPVYISWQCTCWM